MISAAAKSLIIERLDVRTLLDTLKLSYEERGDGLWACCPWHGERTPSFKVGLHSKAFVCFGCHKERALGGGIVVLAASLLDLRRRDVMSDGEHPLDHEAAWRWLAERAGVSVDPAEAARAGLISAPPVAPKDVFHTQLRALDFPADSVHATDSPEALAYLARRCTAEQIQRHEWRWWPSRRRVLVPTVVHNRLVTWDARSIDKRCSACRREVPAVDCGRSCSCGGLLVDLAPKTFSAKLEDGARPNEALFGHDWLPPRAPVVHVTEGPWGALALEARLGEPACALRGSVLHAPQVALLAAWPLVVVWPDGDNAGSLLEGRLGPLVARTHVLVAHLPAGTQPDDHPAEVLRSVRHRTTVPELYVRPVAEFQTVQPKR